MNFNRRRTKEKPQNIVSAKLSPLPSCAPHSHFLCTYEMDLGLILAPLTSCGSTRSQAI